MVPSTVPRLPTVENRWLSKGRHLVSKVTFITEDHIEMSLPMPRLILTAVVLKRIDAGTMPGCSRKKKGL